ncbi:MAG: RNA methyltransferase [Bacteroidales bacterium]|nr:RNA methyltransferase [Bacteroidales bacterium]MDD4217346.1 RNA methyltransferase [Bacteroidales bacterium]
MKINFMVTKITSVNNKLVKNLVVLHNKSRERRKQGLIIIEGIKEIQLALLADVEIQHLYFCPDIVSKEAVDDLFCKISDNVEYFEVSKEVYNKISYRESTGGMVVLARSPVKKLNDLKLADNSVFVILESVEKPGNLGAIARIADGAGVSGIIVSDPRADVFNPNSIRASLGCVFTTDVVVADTQQTMDWLKINKIKIFAAELNASEKYHNLNLRGKVALVFGTEATGLTDKWIKAADQRLRVPMLGKIDSLNVSASVAVVVYEAMRQRNFVV